MRSEAVRPGGRPPERGSSPLAPTRSTPLSSWFARRGSREDYAFRAELLIHSPRTLRLRAAGLASARPKELPRAIAHLVEVGSTSGRLPPGQGAFHRFPAPRRSWRPPACVCHGRPQSGNLHFPGGLHAVAITRSRQVARLAAPARGCTLPQPSFAGSSRSALTKFRNRAARTPSPTR